MHLQIFWSLSWNTTNYSIWNSNVNAGHRRDTDDVSPGCLLAHLLQKHSKEASFFSSKQACVNGTADHSMGLLTIAQIQTTCSKMLINFGRCERILSFSGDLGCSPHLRMRSMSHIGHLFWSENITQGWDQRAQKSSKYERL